MRKNISPKTFKNAKKQVFNDFQIFVRFFLNQILRSQQSSFKMREIFLKIVFNLLLGGGRASPARGPPPPAGLYHPLIYITSGFLENFGDVMLIYKGKP